MSSTRGGRGRLPRRQWLVPFVAHAGLLVAVAGCGLVPSTSVVKAPAPVVAADALLPSPRLLVGRVIAVNATDGFAFIDVAADAPAPALTEGAELLARTLELQQTAQLLVSRYLRGRTLGARIVAGQPSPGDEVVWLAP